MTDAASSPADRAAVAPRPPRLRARVTNGAKLFLAADGRSAAARRLADLIYEFALPHGGMGEAPEGVRQLVRRAASLAVQAELAESAMARGEQVDGRALATVANALSRTLAALKRAEPKATARDAYAELRARLTVAP